MISMILEDPKRAKRELTGHWTYDFEVGWAKPLPVIKLNQQVGIW